MAYNSLHGVRRRTVAHSIGVVALGYTVFIAVGLWRPIMMPWYVWPLFTWLVIGYPIALWTVPSIWLRCYRKDAHLLRLAFVFTISIFWAALIWPKTLFAIKSNRIKDSARLDYVRELSTAIHRRLVESGVPADLVVSLVTPRASIGVHTTACGPMNFDLWVDSTGVTWQPVHHYSPQPSRAYVDELFGRLDGTSSAAQVVAAIEQHLNNVRRDSAGEAQAD